MAPPQLKTLPPAASPLWTESHESLVTTTILVNNVHCTSCTTHIQDRFAGLGPLVRTVGVSIVKHEVHIVHVESVKSADLCHILSEEAFEVCGATTVDKTGKIVSEHDIQRPTNRRLENSIEHLGLSHRTPDGLLDQGVFDGSSCLPLPVRNKRKRHLENCAACQEEAKNNDKSPADAQHRATQMAQSIQPIRESGTVDGVADAQHFKPSLSTTSPTLPASAQLPPSLYKLALSLGGMTYASCSGAINDALDALGYVRWVQVDLMTNSAIVEYHGEESLSKSIVKSVEDLGYDVSIIKCEVIASKIGPKRLPVSNTSIHKALICIGGMTCVACSNGVTEGLKTLPFVKSVNVTLMTNSAVVEYEGKDNLKEVVSKVEDLGYECSVDRVSLIKPAGLPASRIATGQPRAVKLQIDGMFCVTCPEDIIRRLNTVFGASVTVERAPSLKDPVITVIYQPNAPIFTIRDIISVIDSTNDLFRTSFFRHPSIEDRSRRMQIEERNRILKRLIMTCFVALPTLLIGVVWMSLVPESNPIRQALDKPMLASKVSGAIWALFILATPVMFFAADIFHLRAIKEIRALWRKGSRVPILIRFYRFGSMNLLISAGTTVAYVSSLALLIVSATTKNSGSSNTTYFDSVVFLTLFILIGRFLESYSKSKAGDAVAMLGKLRPQEALLVVSSAEKILNLGETLEKAPSTQPMRTQTIPVDLLEVGDKVIVPHGSSPPTDGLVVSGMGKLDESSLTGESRIVKKGPEDKVFVGTINSGDPITVKVMETDGTSMLDQIVAVVREGQTKRAPVERVADVLTGYFVPVITLLAILTFFVWFALGQSGRLDLKYLGDQAGGWGFWSLEFAIAVFVVACPCGIGLAAPTALFVGGGLAAKHGILVRGGGEAFQEAGDLDIVVFDKTGTLTKGGDLQVTDYEVFAEGEDIPVAWSIAKALEEQSSHPMAKAVLSFASARPNSVISAESISEEAGLGVRGTFSVPSTSGQAPARYEAALGSEALMETLTAEPLTKTHFISQLLSRWQTESKSIAILAVRRLPALSDTTSEPPSAWAIASILATSDPIRPSAIPTIRTLQSRGLSVYMLSGDNPKTAHAVASTLGIPATNVFAGVLPTEKAARIAHLQAHGPRRPSRSLAHRLHPPRRPTERPAKVAFVGDGINDAPALLAASVSISLASGSPIALTSSSFVLLGESLAAIPTLLDLSQRVFRRIRWNFAWALVYNVVLVPVAAGVLFRVNEGGWRLGPVWASAAMAGSSVSVVCSSLALRWEGWGSGRTGRKGGA
jgi:heavy metal translocating P-type ATPase